MASDKTKKKRAAHEAYNLSHLGIQLLLADVRCKVHPRDACVGLGQPLRRPTVHHLNAEPAVAFLARQGDAAGCEAKELSALFGRAFGL